MTDTNGSLILWDLSTSGYESVRFLWFERHQIKPATFLLHSSLILWITDENFHLHFHQIFESFPLHCVSAALNYLFVNFQETFFFLLHLFRVMIFLFFFPVKPIFFISALTFVLSSVWVILGFHPRFSLNGCWISLDEGVRLRSRSFFTRKEMHPLWYLEWQWPEIHSRAPPSRGIFENRLHFCLTGWHFGYRVFEPNQQHFMTRSQLRSQVFQ